MKKFCAVIIIVLILLCGCADSRTEDVDAPAGFSTVYDDGIVIIETGRLLRLPGSEENTEYCFLELRLTNNDVSPIYYSGMLCLEASSGGSVLSVKNAAEAGKAAAAAFEDYVPFDGVIKDGEQAEGFIFFEAPEKTDCFDIRLATDFGHDKWVSFSCCSGKG